MSKQLINVGTGELVGDGEPIRSAFVKINSNFDEVYAATATIPTDLSDLNNDLGFITTATFTTTNISLFVNNAGYLTTSTLPTNISYFNNNVGYITSASIPTNVSAFINDIGYLTTGTYPDILGNLEITGAGLQTITGTNVNGSISITPNGTGSVFVPKLEIPVGTILSGTAPIVYTLANLTLDSVIDWSTTSTDSLATGQYGIPNGIPAPWAVYKFTTVPSPSLEVNDIIAGVGIPSAPDASTILHVGTGTWSNTVIAYSDFSVISTATVGTVVTVARATTNATMFIDTNAITDISLNPGPGGNVITSRSILPYTTDVLDLGSPAKRFRQVWLGAGTLYVLDETLGTDQAIGARDGLVYIAGGAGLKVGEFTFRDNRLKIADSTRDIQIGDIGDSGILEFRRKIRVLSNTGTYNLFAVDPEGRVDILSDITSNPTESAVSIIGSRERTVKPPNNLGVLLHLTGSSSATSRIYHDSYGAGNYSAFIGRKARGNSNTATQTLSGDIISRIGANPHDGTDFASISTMRIDFVVNETQTPLTRGNRIEFWTTPNGSTNIGKRVTIDGSDIILTSGGGGGITFADSTRQTTAWTGTINVSQVQGTEAILATTVRSITAGNGITVTTSTGNVGINATGVQNVYGTTNRIIVSDAGSKNLTLTTPQDLNTTASVTFQNITITGNLNVSGTATIATNASVVGKILYLATSATNASQIDGGGIILGTSTFARSILYSQVNDWWDTNGAGLKTLHLEATTATADTLFVNGVGHFGLAYAGFDFANAEIQADGNVNDFLQVVIKNHNSGTNASSDFIASNDIGDDTQNFIDLGINSSNYNNPDYSITQANDGYLFVEGGNLAIGTASPSKTIVFHTGGTTSSNLRAEINDNGIDVVGGVYASNFNNVTITQPANNAVLTLGSNSIFTIANSATITFNQSITFPSNTGTSTYVLASNGVGGTVWVPPNSGPQGPQGVGGPQGPQGVQGNVGPQGPQGVAGVAGPQGPQGVAGVAGPQGPQGVAGVNGPQGPQGVAGVNGPQGPQGPAGSPGNVGPQGPQGVAGAAGPQGPQGVAGAAGPQGPQGVAGATGPQGPIGNTGAQGPQGVAGPQGPQGVTGNIGPTGPTGPQGVVGPQGPQGVAGVAGPQGVQGPTGPGSTKSVNFIIDGGGAAVTTGTKGYVVVDLNCTINSWTILSDSTGSVVVDVKRCTYANFPTTTSITDADKPTLFNARKNQNNTLSSWTSVSIVSGDILEFVVDSASTATRVTIDLKLTAT